MWVIADGWYEQQEHRKQHVQIECSKQSIEKREVAQKPLEYLLKHRHLLSNLLVDKTRKILYCYVPKVSILNGNITSGYVNVCYSQ